MSQPLCWHRRTLRFLAPVFLTVAAVLPISLAKAPVPPVAGTVEATPVGPPLFEDVTGRAGIDFAYRNGEDAGNYAIIESVGGGLALFDYDGDGRLDLFVPGGGRYEGKAVRGLPGRLYRNRGDWKFEDVTAAVGLGSAVQYTHGAAAFDYDNDGWTDLLLTGYNRLVLYRNDSGKRFVDVTQKAGLTDAQWSSSAGWGDLDGDGFPEIYVCHYGDWGFDTNHPTDCTYDGKTRDVCQPRRFNPLQHTLYRNNGNGTFADATNDVALRKDGRGLGVIFADLNRDGKPDVYVANDTDDNHLYVNQADAKKLKLTETGLLAGVARDDDGRANGSMGLDVADFDRTGLPSIIVTNYESELPALYLNRSIAGQERFRFGTVQTGLAAIQGIYVSWGTAFQDFDHDGWEDLVIVNGHAIRFPAKTDRRQKPVLVQNDRGKFKVNAMNGGGYFEAPHNARGLAAGDLDNDGRIDLVVSHLNEPVSVLRNVAPTDGRHWLGLELVGKGNRDVVGARVEIESAGGKQTRYAKGGGSFASTNDPRLVVGLGSDTAVTKVTVHWPWGGTQEVSGVKVDAYQKVVEGR